MATYIPDRGDFVWIDLNPRTGHEQSGRRPGVILSPKAYNRKTGLCVLCPATRQAKGYAFEVQLVDKSGHVSTVLADHVRSVDWRTRKVQFIQRTPNDVVEEIVAKLEALISVT